MLPDPVRTSANWSVWSGRTAASRGHHHGRGAVGAGRESKARELRGESMQDVIFNGYEYRASPRQPFSVELVFI